MERVKRQRISKAGPPPAMAPADKSGSRVMDLARCRVLEQERMLGGSRGATPSSEDSASTAMPVAISSTQVSSHSAIFCPDPFPGMRGMQNQLCTWNAGDCLGDCL